MDTFLPRCGGPSFGIALQTLCTGLLIVCLGTFHTLLAQTPVAGIDESGVPAGAVALFQPNIWQQYEWQILCAITLVIVETLLIAFLLVSRTRRRRAEARGDGNTLDISDRKQAEWSVRESEERFRIMADATPVIVFVSDADMQCTFFNKHVLDFTGRTNEELLGSGWLDVVHQDDRERCINIYTKAGEEHKPFIMEFRARRADGEFRWIYDTAAPRFGPGGKFEGYIGTGIDITDRRLAEEAIRESEALFRHMADSAPVLIWMADLEALCTFFNRQVLEFTGRSMDELMGEGWLEIIHEDDLAQVVETYKRGYESLEPFIIEFRVKRADGEFRWVYDIGSPRFASDGSFLGYIGSVVDITDRKSAEEALQIAHEEVSKLKNQLEAENVYLQEEIKLAHNVNEIIGESQAIKYVLFKIQQVAPTDASVLIQGETGTGKELVARAIHSASPRKDRQMVKINCAALPANLIESELFGHEKGAFTGAQARKIGRFEIADGATLFLDEIGELPLELQPKLLRVLQEGEFERLGSSQTRKVDVRIIAATNRHLKAEVQNGLFREDLWYRLNVFPITIPPLRQRKSDVAMLVSFFVSRSNRKLGRIVKTVSPHTMRALEDYPWPGNVRELANVVDRALINSTGTVLQLADKLDAGILPAVDGDGNGKPLGKLEDVERDHIISVLNVCEWRIEGSNGAATVLGINSSTLRSRMNKLGIKRPKPASSAS